MAKLRVTGETSDGALILLICELSFGGVLSFLSTVCNVFFPKSPTLSTYGLV